jgi:hypothetical protein
VAGVLSWSPQLGEEYIVSNLENNNISSTKIIAKERLGLPQSTAIVKVEIILDFYWYPVPDPRHGITANHG